MCGSSIFDREEERGAGVRKDQEGHVKEVRGVIGDEQEILERGVVGNGQVPDKLAELVSRDKDTSHWGKDYFNVGIKFDRDNKVSKRVEGRRGKEDQQGVGVIDSL